MTSDLSIVLMSVQVLLSFRPKSLVAIFSPIIRTIMENLYIAQACK